MWGPPPPPASGRPSRAAGPQRTPSPGPVQARHWLGGGGVEHPALGSVHGLPLEFSGLRLSRESLDAATGSLEGDPPVHVAERLCWGPERAQKSTHIRSAQLDELTRGGHTWSLRPGRPPMQSRLPISRLRSLQAQAGDLRPAARSPRNFVAIGSPGCCGSAHPTTGGASGVHAAGGASEDPHVPLLSGVAQVKGTHVSRRSQFPGAPPRQGPDGRRPCSHHWVLTGFLIWATVGAVMAAPRGLRRWPAPWVPVPLLVAHVGVPSRGGAARRFPVYSRKLLYTVSTGPSPVVCRYRPGQQRAFP